jgi:nicotinate-nucleotide--dimethylbenzimidazole phosphoribosyltransferase
MITIPPVDPKWFHQAAAHQSRLTMPAGALGRLLELGQQLCAIQETLHPLVEPSAVVVMAADHGIAAEGVSAYPPEVTAQMVVNFLRGGAAINVLARRQRAAVFVVDMGLRTTLDQSALTPEQRSRLIVSNLGVRGTANFLREPALTREQVVGALETGRTIVAEYLVPAGVRAVALGEMGIGNTTSASALTAALTGLPASAVTGRGTGLSDEALQHKRTVIERSLERHFPGRSGPVAPLEALEAVGGLEIAGLVGVALAGAAHRMVVVLDGFISSVAGLIAAQLEPAARGYLVAGHRSVEIGHGAVLEALGLQPLLDLGLRLGEGTGAVLALTLLTAAADILTEMATFETAGVSQRPDS